MKGVVHLLCGCSHFLVRKLGETKLETISQIWPFHLPNLGREIRKMEAF